MVLGYGFLLALYSNYGRIFSRFDTIHKRDSTTLWRQQRPRSLFEKTYATSKNVESHVFGFWKKTWKNVKKR